MGIEALKEQARGHEQAEEWEKALDLYTQAIERQSEDEHADLGLFNRAGDLSTRLGNLEGALAHYEQAVKLYLESELPNNAIAILKKILRNMPYRTDVFLQMGQIRAGQGFLVDARENFLKYAEIMQQEDNLPEALRALTEFAGLAQDDVDVQLMVASQLHANERTEEAVQLLVASYAHHLRIGKSDGLETLGGRIHEIDPSTALPTDVADYDAFETTTLTGGGIGGSHEEIDEEEVSAVSDGLEIESTHLGNLDEELADAADTVADEVGLESELVDQITDADLNDEAPFETIASEDDWGLESTSSEGDAGIETLSLESSDLAFGDGLDLDAVIADNDAAAVELDATTLEVDAPVDLEAAARELASLAGEDELDVEASLDVSNDEDLTPVLETDELDAAAEALTSDLPEPEGSDAGELELSSDQWGADLKADLGDADPEAFEGADLSSSWLAVESVDDDPDAEPLEMAVEVGSQDEAEPGAEADETVLLEMHTTAGVGEAEVERNADPIVPEEALLSADDDTDLIEAAGLEDAWLRVEPAEEADPPLALESIGDDTDQQSDWQSDAAEEAGVGTVADDWIGAAEPVAEAPVDDPETWLHLASQFQQEGDREQARTALVEAHLGFSERLDFQKASVAVASLIALEPESLEHHERRIEYLDHAGDRAAKVAAHLDFAEALAQRGKADEARAEYEKVLEIDPSNQLAQSQLQEGPEPEIESGYIDLGSMVIDRVEKTTRWTVETEEPVDEEDFDFRQMLSQFKQKVAEHVDVGDVRAHYDLGTAYREMGLMDEAISEFQLALRADDKNLATYEMLGQCFMEKGQPDFAVRSLGKAANLPHDVEDELLGIYYYLGRAHEELGQRDEAVEFYEKVFALDINFQDVTERLRSLR